jgi:hypothetical protein
VLTDLVSLAQSVDPNNESSDYRKKKTFNFYDPYGNEDDKAFAHLHFEDQIQMRASITVQMHLA